MEDEEWKILDCLLSFRKARKYFGMNASELNGLENLLGGSLKRNTSRSHALSARKILLAGLTYLRRGTSFVDVGIEIDKKNC